MLIVLECNEHDFRKRETLQAEQKINSGKGEEIKPSNGVTFAYFINLTVSMPTVSFLCQVSAARSYVSLCINNLYHF